MFVLYRLYLYHVLIYPYKSVCLLFFSYSGDRYLGMTQMTYVIIILVVFWSRVIEVVKELKMFLASKYLNESRRSVIYKFFFFFFTHLQDPRKFLFLNFDKCFPFEWLSRFNFLNNWINSDFKFLIYQSQFLITFFANANYAVFFFDGMFVF